MDGIKDWNLDYKNLSDKMIARLMITIVCDPEMQDVEFRTKGIYGKGKESLDRLLEHIRKIAENRPLPKEPVPRLKAIDFDKPVVFKCKVKRS